MKLSSKLSALSLSVLVTGPLSAATRTGDTVSLRNFGSFGSFDTSGVVGPGIDVDLFNGAFSAELDAAFEGMDLVVRNLSGFSRPSLPGRVEFSSLDLSSGEVLTGFTLNPDQNFLGVTVEAIAPPRLCSTRP